jgi:hypothetical protein
LIGERSISWSPRIKEVRTVDHLSRTEPVNAAPDPRQWKALALLCVAFSMVILDARIVILGLPSIEAELDMSADAGHWVMSGCLLSFQSAFAWALVFPAVGLLYAALLLGWRRALGPDGASALAAEGGGQVSPGRRSTGTDRLTSGKRGSRRPTSTRSSGT